MAGNLKSRLARLRELGPERAPESPAGRSQPPAPAKGAAHQPGAARPACLDGWEKLADFVWRRELRHSLHLPGAIDPRPFELRSLAASRSGMARGAPLEAAAVTEPGAAAPRDAAGSAPHEAEEPMPTGTLRFFDLETTGLSGGSGTVAFLAAVGRVADGGFAVVQLFLEDYPGEPAWLAALLAELGEGTSLVTYNGRAFDLPLLRTRCVMNGIRPPEFRNLDLLYAARRLWRRVHGGASLGLLERGVLDAERGLDVPGSMLPDIWFGFLREGDHPLMRAAMAHNAEDVASLERLLASAARIYSEPRAWAASGGVDRAGLGRSLFALGRLEEGEALLEAALADGDEAAGLLLSRRFRREGRLEDRARVVAALPESFASLVERAKFHEHALRDFKGALAWTARAEGLARASQGGLPAEETARLEARRTRLERKLAVSGRKGRGA